ncbi:hypothetical protein F7230_03765 [Corynebacterium sp. 320]|uniref:hypothetical protein n=1 Tax=Corynebacterium TaxID=1716 RepID=UPI00125CC79F|nr:MULTISPECIES: hypothetical protein [Corynebacterium]KAB1504211.1 hypothetical protein F7230_03765 [Corynebacterium sp. 320]KAB1552689.1 hypothetical protein F7233_02825 [Corynebacterium sp. 321]KAB1554093.1 hypothetical protein F7232_03760 [Corynebacterium sp. 319]KAB3528347.1 hypothetical protein F8354_03765 [Corynebacterium sp. 250]KAB3540164.1 hypothetical protein F8390_02570 [Corynebacterium sp. 366]
MAHYDLYRSLGLSSTESSDSLRAAIDAMLASGTYPNKGGKAELDIAREVLGNDRKRTMYDAKLSDPQASDVTVRDLKKLAEMPTPGSGSSAEASSSTDTGEIPVVTPRNQKPQPEPPQYRQAPPTLQQPDPQQGYGYGAQQGYQAQYQQPQEQPKKKKGGLIAAILLVTLLALGGAGTAVYFFVLSPEWKGTQQELKEAFPKLVSERQNAKGWHGLKCQGADPDRDQTGKILCGDKDTVLSVVQFDSAQDREKYLPTEDVETLDNGKCTAKSAEVQGNSKPTYAVWPTDQNDLALLITGNDAETLRLQLPLCK